MQFNITKGEHLLTKEIQERLSELDIWCNDLMGELFCFDFKVGNTWVENIKPSNDLKEITLMLTEVR